MAELGGGLHVSGGVTAQEPGPVDTDRFSLAWNDFPDNVTAIFRQLRRDGGLSDVTLMCSGGRQVAAHKVVLSASSSFFRQFLRDNTQAHPWLFLRGVDPKLLDWLLDFIYLGEVQVTQESFAPFLGLARELGVRGLTGITPVLKPKETFTKTLAVARDTFMPPPPFTDVSEGTVEYLADVVKTEPQEEEQEIKLPDFDLLDDSYERDLVINEDDDINTLSKEERVKLRVKQRLLNAERRLLVAQGEAENPEQTEVNAELDRRISEMIVKKEGAWVCTVCGKNANHKSKLKQHAETHLQGYSHPCTLCGKTYRSRNVLRMHLSRDHRSKGHMDLLPKMTTSPSGHLIPRPILPKPEEARQDLPGQKLSGPELSGQKLSGQELSAQQLSGQKLSGQELSGQEPSSQKLSGLQLSGQRLSGQQLSGQQLSGQEPGQNKLRLEFLPPVGAQQAGLELQKQQT